MIKYEADHEGSGQGNTQFEGKVECLAIEAAVLVRNIYDYLNSKNKESAEAFLSIFNGLVNDKSRRLYEVESHGD